jgi:hypothetical protein
MGAAFLVTTRTAPSAQDLGALPMPLQCHWVCGSGDWQMTSCCIRSAAYRLVMTGGQDPRQRLRTLGHFPNERPPAGPVGAGQGQGGVAAGRQEQALEQLPRGEDVPGAQARRAAVGSGRLGRPVRRWP